MLHQHEKNAEPLLDLRQFLQRFRKGLGLGLSGVPFAFRRVQRDLNPKLFDYFRFACL